MDMHVRWVALLSLMWGWILVGCDDADIDMNDGVSPPPGLATAAGLPPLSDPVPAAAVPPGAIDVSQRLIEAGLGRQRYAQLRLVEAPSLWDASAYDAGPAGSRFSTYLLQTSKSQYADFNGGTVLDRSVSFTLPADTVSFSLVVPEVAMRLEGFDTTLDANGEARTKLRPVITSVRKNGEELVVQQQGLDGYRYRGARPQALGLERASSVLFPVAGQDARGTFTVTVSIQLERATPDGTVPVRVTTPVDLIVRRGAVTEHKAVIPNLMVVHDGAIITGTVVDDLVSAYRHTATLFAEHGVTLLDPSSFRVFLLDVHADPQAYTYPRSQLESDLAPALRDAPFVFSATHSTAPEDGWERAPAFYLFPAFANNTSGAVKRGVSSVAAAPGYGRALLGGVYVDVQVGRLIYDFSLSAQDRATYSFPAFMAQVLSHEIGHYFGLNHTTEHDDRFHDPFMDTLECSQNGQGTLSTALCGPGRDDALVHDLMFPSLNVHHRRLSPQQVDALQHHPLLAADRPF